MALTYNSINMQYAIPWNTIKAALCNMSERTFIRKSHFSCSWLLITQMIPGLLFDCWLVVCSKSQVTRYDVHWNPLLACFLSPQRPLRRCWGSPWGGGSVLVLSSRASVAPKQPQGRVRPPESRAWFYASVHYYWRRRVFCQLWMGQKTAPMWSDDQVWSFDQVMYTGVLVHIAQATIILSQYQVAPPMWCYSDRRSRGYCSGNYRRNKFSWSCWVEESIEETRRR